MSDFPVSLNPFRASAAVLECPAMGALTLRSIHMDADRLLTFCATLYEGQRSWWKLARDRQPIATLRVDLFEPTGVIFRTFTFTDLAFVSYCPFLDVDYGGSADKMMVEQIQYRAADFTVAEIDTDLALEGEAP